MSSPLRIVLTVVLAVAAVAAARQASTAWFGFVTTRGVSMQPTYHAGDLVLIRKSGSYEVGDIVAYQSDTLQDEVVLHRIVEIEDGRATTRGDNNDWVDDDRPALDEIEGRAVLGIPRVGGLINRIRPLLAAGAAALLVLALTATGRRKRRPKHLIETTQRSVAMQDRRAETYRRAQRALQMAGAVGLGGMALLAITFVRDPQVSETEDVSYQHVGAFEHHATTASPTVYPDGSADTGEPIYRRLVDELTVEFDYRLESSSAADAAAGAARMEIELSNGAWQRTVSLGDEVPLRDGAAALEAHLDLSALGDTVAAMARETGEPVGPFTVSVRPTVELSGSLAGAALDSEFSPQLDLDVDAIRATVDPAQLEPTEAGSVALSRLVDRPLTLGPLSVTHDVARLGAVAAMTVAAVVALLAARQARRCNADESIRIRASHPDKVVSVAGVLLRDQVVDVTSVQSLLKLAEHDDRFILHTARDGRDWFVVDDGHTTFRYEVAA